MDGIMVEIRRPQVIRGNLLAGIPGALPDELMEVLQTGTGVRIERIVSLGHATPPGRWYDQEQDEWVVLITGAAGLRIEGENADIELRPGDYLNLPAHCRHRVEWTDPDVPTVWLALHYQK